MGHLLSSERMVRKPDTIPNVSRRRQRKGELPGRVRLAVIQAIRYFSILKRVQKWRLLHPGETAKQTVPKEELHYEAENPGKYDFWAEYHPPAIEPDDQKTLRKAGIDFPRESLGSKHVVYYK